MNNFFRKLRRFSVIRLYYDIFYGFRNLWRWRKVIWHDNDCDWEFLVILMQQKLKFMKQHFEESRRHKSVDQDIKNIGICIVILQRILDDEYVKLSGFGELNLSEKENKRRYDLMNYLEKQDLEYLGIMFRKHLKCWWD